MATDLGQLVYTLTLNDEGFAGQVNRATGQVEESGGKMAASQDEAAASSGRFKSAFSSMAGQFVIGAALFTVGQKALGLLKGGIDGAMEASKGWQAAQAQMNAGLKSTHDASGMTAESMKELAEATQKHTAISRESVLTGENMLLTFTGIGKKVFPQATQAVADMATRMNGGAVPTMQQMNDKALLLGKALNDPEKGLAKLQKAGVMFTDQQKEQIKTMEAAGNMAGAQKIMLDELSKEFGGSAAAAAGTYQGKIAQLKNQFNDLVANGMQKLKSFLPDLEAAFMKAIEGMQKIVKALQPEIQAVTVFFKLLWEVITGGDPTLSRNEARFAGLAKIMSQLGFYFDEFRTAIKLIWEAIRGGDPALDQNHLQMSRFVIILDKAVAIIKQVASTVMGVFKAAWDALKMAVEGLLPSLEALFSQLMNNIMPVLKEVWSSVMRLYNAVSPALIDIIKILAVIVGVTLYAAIYVAINVLRIGIEVLGAVAHAIALVIGWISNLIGWFGTATVAVIRFVGNAASWFSSLPGRIQAAVSGFGHLLVDAGGSLIDGLVHGIENAAHRVFDAVKNVGDKAVKELKGVLKIFSPSQVFAELGGHISTGLAQGITAAANVPIQATTQMATNVINAGKSTPVSSSSNNSSSLVYNFQAGSVVLSTSQAVDEFFSIGNRNAQLEAGGLSPLSGTIGV